MRRFQRRRLILVYLVGLSLSVPLCSAGQELDRESADSTHPALCALLINNDPAERHQANIKTAVDALKPFAFDEIIALGQEEPVPTIQDVSDALERIQKKGGRLGLLYITGHGSLLISRSSPQGRPSVMLRDRPLTPQWLAPLLGNGPCLIYLDQCYAPAFMEDLGARLAGDFLLLSDKHEEDPNRSCRGVSIPFWKLLKEKAVCGSIYTAAYESWKTVCLKGKRLRLEEEGS